MQQRANQIIGLVEPQLKASTKSMKESRSDANDIIHVRCLSAYAEALPFCANPVDLGKIKILAEAICVAPDLPVRVEGLGQIVDNSIDNLRIFCRGEAHLQNGYLLISRVIISRLAKKVVNRAHGSDERKETSDEKFINETIQMQPQEVKELWVEATERIERWLQNRDMRGTSFSK